MVYTPQFEIWLESNTSFLEPIAFTLLTNFPWRTLSKYIVKQDSADAKFLGRCMANANRHGCPSHALQYNYASKKQY